MENDQSVSFPEFAAMSFQSLLRLGERKSIDANFCSISSSIRELYNLKEFQINKRVAYRVFQPYVTMSILVVDPSPPKHA